MAIQWLRGPGNAKTISVSVDENDTPEGHRINCEEFALMAYIQLGESTYGNFKTDPIAKEAIDNTYSTEQDPNEYGIKFWDEYCALKDNTTTVPQEDKISDYDTVEEDTTEETEED